MAIIKGTRNADAARKFVDWALSPEGAEDRPRRQGIRDSDQPQRRRCRRRCRTLTDDQGHRLRLREIRLVSESASACSSAGRRKSTRRRDEPLRAGSPSRLARRSVAIGFLARPVVRAAGQRARRRRGCATTSARTTRRRWCRRSRHGRAWLLPIGVAARRRRCCPPCARSRATRANALIAIGGARLRLPARARLRDRPARLFVSRGSPRVRRRSPAASTGWDSARRWRRRAFAMLFALGLAERGAFKGDAFVACSVVAVSVLVAIFTFFPVATILVQAVAGRRRRVLAARVRRAAVHREDLGRRLPRRRRRAAASRGTR